MSAINLELRAIRLHKGLSEETPAYTAALWLDGRNVASLSNQGHGGCDMVHWLDKTAEAKVTAHFAAMPPEPCDLGGGRTFDLQPNLEGWAHAAVWDADLLKTIKRGLARKVIGICGGKELHFTLPLDRLDGHAKDGRTFRAIIAEKHPGVVILNGLTDAAILAACKSVTA